MANQQAPARVPKKQPENTVAMFGYYVPYWIIAVVFLLLLAMLHNMKVVNMSCLVPTCFVPGSQVLVTLPKQSGGAFTDDLTPVQSLLPNINSTDMY